MSTLILTLTPEMPGPSTEYGYTLTADGHTAQRNASASAALLPDPGRAGETVAVVPSRLLSWHRVTLPQGTGTQAPRLRAVLEGLLEERVLDDTVLLHFALEPGARAGEPAWVAVCDRTWLRATLQALEAAGRPVSRVVPEFAPGPTGSGAPEYFATGTPDDPQLVITGHGANQAVVVLPLTPASLDWAGATTAQGVGDPDAAPPAPLRAEPAVATLAERLLGRPAEIHTASQRALAAARGSWDLAQFDLASSGRRRAVKRAGSLMAGLLRAPQWRAARWGLGILLVAQLVGLNAWAWKERSALDARQSALHAVLTQTFPSVRVVVDAPVQMERELALLRQATGVGAGAGLEGLLSAVGAALPPGASAQAVDFLNNELRLRGFDPAQAAPLAEKLRAQGIGARTEGDVLVLRPEGTP